MKTFVDTNVLVYAHDADAGARHATAKALLAELWDSRDGSLSTQVLQEFYAVVTRKFEPPAAIHAGADRLVSEDLQDGRRFGSLTIENPFIAD